MNPASQYKRPPFDDLLPWLSKIPEPDCDQPRDRLPLAQTSDYLFLALLLQRGHGHKYLLRLKGKKPRYLPEGAPVAPSRIRDRVSLKSIRKLFRASFFQFRSLINRPACPNLEIRLEGNLLCTPKEWCAGQPFTLGATLRHGFSQEGDPLLKNLHTIHFLAWGEGAKGLTRRKRGQTYCPIDGPVKPVPATIRTAPKTWAGLHGRQWLSWFCPHCLCDLHTSLEIMN